MPDETERALELADLVSELVWGGERGWERCTDEQFKILKSTLTKRYRVGARLHDTLEKHLNSAHYFNVVVRDGGKDVVYELDWIKQVLSKK